ncbi:NAD-dependent protein deacetylase Sirt2-like [Anopheles darlingi]|uniref:NAD-dependent protein deacetylase Sirt2-like n=1 Tax=Anopheles darlingi TaxID=43151 RepID=UPI002100560F|nr:NAD-dependent protein deacetylase Sirt2-like [Anopheles darlingi]
MSEERPTTATTEAAAASSTTTTHHPPLPPSIVGDGAAAAVGPLANMGGVVAAAVPPVVGALPLPLTEPASDPTIAPIAPINGPSHPSVLTEFQQYADDSEEDEGEGESYRSESICIERIRQYLSDKLGFYSPDGFDEKDATTVGTGRRILETVDVEGVIKHWKNGGFKKIVTMVGAGISTSAGIPDFRSPDTGLYNNLMKYNLPYPQAIFELEYLYQNPKPFFTLAKELYPGTFKPTPSHYFVRLLEQKGLLVRHYTQNIDTLERIAGIHEDKIVEAHGTFYTNHCLQCKTAYSLEFVKEKIFADEVPTCPCGGVIKPDIVFFGEGLPERFHMLPHQDFAECDLLIIMGTSLTVQPFASLVEYVNDDCVRLLINRDKVGGGGFGFFRSMMFGEGLCFDLPGNRRDVAWTGNCDDGCFFLADQLGWGDELRQLVETEHAKIVSIRPTPSIPPTVAPAVAAAGTAVVNGPIAIANPAVATDASVADDGSVTSEDEHFNDVCDGGGSSDSVHAMATDPHHDNEHHHQHHHHHPHLHHHHHHHHQRHHDQQHHHHNQLHQQHVEHHEMEEQQQHHHHQHHQQREESPSEDKT